MKKKLISIFVILICINSMISCNMKSTSKNEHNKKPRVEDLEHHHEHEHDHNHEHEHGHDHEHGHHHDISGKEIDTEIGKRTIIKGIDELDETKSNGPFNFKINAAQISKLEINQENLEKFNGEKEIYFVTLNLFIEHQSQGVNKIDFNKSIILSSNNVEYKADQEKSDPLSGEFNGNAMDQGNLVFIVDSSYEKETKINLRLPQGVDEGNNPIGNIVDFEINFRD